MEREALKLALETLKWANKEINEWMDDAQGLEQEIMLAITAIKEALAQPAQEPVAWIDIDEKGNRSNLKAWSDGSNDEKPLYTAPPQRSWIWLSDADIKETIDSICQYSGDYEEFLCKKIERKIKELNT